MNRVSYMCPVTISNDVVQGQTDIQDSLTVDSGGNLYIINAPVYVGGPNQPDHGHRTAHLVIRNGGTMTLLGNLPDHMTVFPGGQGQRQPGNQRRPPSDGPGAHSGRQGA